LDNNDVSDNVRAAQISNAAVAVRASHNMSNYGVSSANGNIKRSANAIAKKQSPFATDYRGAIGKRDYSGKTACACVQSAHISEA